MELYPHQQRAVDQLKNGSILWGGVGSGKTITALYYYLTKEVKGVPGDFGSGRNPVDLFVITTAKKRDSLDWETEAGKLGITRDPVDSFPGTSITVDSWQNIQKYKEVRDAFFIFDEQKLVGSGAWTKAFIKIAQHNRWILLSATPGDTWLDYIPVFVANGFYKNRTEFKREHVVYSPYSKFPKVERYLGVGKLVRQRNSILVHMPYNSHTTRHVLTLPVTYDEDLFKKVVKQRWHVYENRPLRNVAELFSVMRKVVNSDATRLKEVQNLLLKHPRLIVFYNFNYELEILRTLTSLNSYLSTSESETDSNKQQGLVVAEWNGHKHEPVPESDRWVYLVQYQSGAEGWNCVSTDACLFYSLTYSYKQWHQSFGRIDRLNTPYTDLYYYVLLSNSAIDRAVKKSLDAKRSFNESDFDFDV